jgi:hypothetical protein
MDFMSTARASARLGFERLGRLLSVGGIELLQIARDALLNLRHAPVPLGEREVFVAIVDRLELPAVNGDAGLHQQTHHAAQRNDARAHFADGSAIVLAEVGNRLVIWSQTPEVEREGTVTSAPLHRQLDGLVHRNIHRVST